jgi:hypothetical protein
MMEKQKRSVVAAKGLQRPETTGVASVFDIAQSVAVAKKGARKRLDYGSVKIKSGVPIPPSGKSAGATAAKLLSNMRPMDCIEVPKNSVSVIRAAAHRLGIKITARNLDTDGNLVGIWRL